MANNGSIAADRGSATPAGRRSCSSGRWKADRIDAVDLTRDNLIRWRVVRLNCLCGRRHEVVVRAVAAADENKALAETKRLIGNWHAAPATDT